MHSLASSHNLNDYRGGAAAKSASKEKAGSLARTPLLRELMLEYAQEKSESK
jgi:hypothetical protein